MGEVLSNERQMTKHPVIDTVDVRPDALRGGHGIFESAMGVQSGKPMPSRLVDLDGMNLEAEFPHESEGQQGLFSSTGKHRDTVIVMLPWCDDPRVGQAR